MRKEYKVFTIKFTESEYLRLKVLAKGQPIGPYLKSLIRGEGAIENGKDNTWANYEKKIDDLNIKLSILSGKSFEEKLDTLLKSDDIKSIKEDLRRLIVYVGAQAKGNYNAMSKLKDVFPKLYDKLVDK